MKTFYILFLLQSCSVHYSEKPEKIQENRERTVFYKVNCYSNGVLFFDKNNFTSYGHTDNGFFFYDKNEHLTNVSGDCVVEEQ